MPVAKSASDNSGLPPDKESAGAPRSDAPNSQAKQLRNRPEQPPGRLSVVERNLARLFGSFLNWLGMEPDSTLQPPVSLVDEAEANQTALPAPPVKVSVNLPETTRAARQGGAKAQRRMGGDERSRSSWEARVGCGVDPSIKCQSCSQIEQYCADKPWTTLPRYKHLLPCLNEHFGPSMLHG